MNTIEFTKVCELTRKSTNEIIHIFENDNDKLRIVTKNKEDYIKNKKYKIVIEEVL